jgi:anti-sigma B factor antagonist
VYWTQVDKRHAAGVVILDVHGQATVSSETRIVVDTIRQLLRDGETRILVNLAHVPYIDSLGIGDIVRGFTAAHRAGATLKLCGIAGRVRMILDATQLTAVIESFDLEQDALESFESAPT